MLVKQLKRLISDQPDDTEIYIITGNLEVYKPDDDLFFLCGKINGLTFLIGDDYPDMMTDLNGHSIIRIENDN